MGKYKRCELWWHPHVPSEPALLQMEIRFGHLASRSMTKARRGIRFDAVLQVWAAGIVQIEGAMTAKLNNLVSTADINLPHLAEVAEVILTQRDVLFFYDSPPRGAQAIAFAADLDDISMMQQAIERGRNQRLIV